MCQILPRNLAVVNVWRIVDVVYLKVLGLPGSVKDVVWMCQLLVSSINGVTVELILVAACTALRFHRHHIGRLHGHRRPR